MRFIIASVVFCISLVSIDATAQTIVVHRGASHQAPENTLSAFRLAWAEHADAIEGDFYLTRDQQIVCIHDKTTKRVAPGQTEMTVAESTCAELRTLDVGCWKDPQYAGERIPTLTQVLATIPPGKQIFVEIKCGPEILPILKCQLAESGLASEQIVMIAFNKAVVTQSRQMMPQYKANWLTGYDKKKETGEWTPSREVVLETLQTTGATGLGSHGNLSVLDASLVEAVRAANREFHVWTVNEADEARTFKSLGADSITTDRPAFIREAVEQVPVESSTP